MLPSQKRCPALPPAHERSRRLWIAQAQQAATAAAAAAHHSGAGLDGSAAPGAQAVDPPVLDYYKTQGLGPLQKVIARR